MVRYLKSASCWSQRSQTFEDRSDNLKCLGLDWMTESSSGSLAILVTTAASSAFSMQNIDVNLKRWKVLVLANAHLANQSVVV